MANGYINELTQVANTKKAGIATALLMYKRADADNDGLANASDLQKQQLATFQDLSRQAARNNELEADFKAGNPLNLTIDEQGGLGNVAKREMGRYGAPVGLGAGAGAIAGIPIGILANALFGKDKGLRGHLRAALLGGLVGGGAGALGGGALKFLSDKNPALQRCWPI